MKLADKKIEKLIRKLLEQLGEDPTRFGLVDTPARVARAWKEWTIGYSSFPHSLTLFPSNFDGMVVRKGIPFSSTCEHHMVHYSGTIDFGYIPNGNVLGISKIVRLMQHYSSRLTIQEDLTKDLVQKFEEIVKPKGTVIKVTAFHSCESTRGINTPNVPTITSMATGMFKKEKELMNEFYRLIG